MDIDIHVRTSNCARFHSKAALLLFFCITWHLGLNPIIMTSLTLGAYLWPTEISYNGRFLNEWSDTCRVFNMRSFPWQGFTKWSASFLNKKSLPLSKEILTKITKSSPVDTPCNANAIRYWRHKFASFKIELMRNIRSENGAVTSKFVSHSQGEWTGLTSRIFHHHQSERALLLLLLLLVY